jgi:GntR family transcriptional regulator, transcriptional repressor for pyruvate dehydrogenase complex
MEATLRPVIRQPVYLQVAERIRDAILDGTLPVGEPLPSERSLQVTFGVGRTTVREGLRALEAQGLIGRSTGGWRSVAAPSLQTPLREALVQLIELDRVRVEDLLDLRLILEPAAVERAARVRDEAALARASRYLEEMQQPGVTVRAFQEADVLFHVALAEASGNGALHLLMQTLREVVDRYMRAIAAEVGDLSAYLPEATAEHADILAAVERGDSEAAAAHVRQHLHRSGRVLEEHGRRSRGKAGRTG